MTPENVYIFFITYAIINYDLATINRQGDKKCFQFDIFNQPNRVIFAPNNIFCISNFFYFSLTNLNIVQRNNIIT